jgi:hypothetical protein
VSPSLVLFCFIISITVTWHFIFTYLLSAFPHWKGKLHESRNITVVSLGPWIVSGNKEVLDKHFWINRHGHESRYKYRWDRDRWYRSIDKWYRHRETEISGSPTSQTVFTCGFLHQTIRKVTGLPCEQGLRCFTRENSAFCTGLASWL